MADDRDLRDISLLKITQALLMIAVKAMSAVVTLIIVVVYLALRRWFRFLP